MSPATESIQNQQIDESSHPTKASDAADGATPKGKIVTLAIKMNALSRPRKLFNNLLEKKKKDNHELFALERQMEHVKPNQKTLSHWRDINPQDQDFYQTEDMVCI